MKEAMEWCLTDVKSPYDGKVASVFVYICHTQEGKSKGHPITGHEGPTGGVEV
jgi:hypothetical protein